MTLDIGKLLKSTAELGTTFHRRQRSPGSSNGRTAGSDPAGGGSTPSPGTNYLTMSRIFGMGRTGTIYLSPLGYTEILCNVAGLRRYTATPRPIDNDGILRMEGPLGLIAIKADSSLTGSAHRWTDESAEPPGPVQKCSYCGAPGQRIGARCEYCQVAVSR